MRVENLFSGSLLAVGVLGVSLVGEISDKGSGGGAGVIFILSIMAIIFSQMLRIK